MPIEPFVNRQQIHSVMRRKQCVKRENDLVALSPSGIGLAEGDRLANVLIEAVANEVSVVTC